MGAVKKIFKNFNFLYNTIICSYLLINKWLICGRVHTGFMHTSLNPAIQSTTSNRVKRSMKTDK